MAQQNADVIVVGAGIAGLICANYLARGGRRVLLLEHNHQAGGCLSGIRRRGFYFDCGCQSFEQLGTVFPLLEGLGLYRPEEWVPVSFRIKAPTFDLPIGSLEACAEEMARCHPDDAAGIRAYFAEARAVAELARAVTEPRGLPLAQSGVIPRLRALGGALPAVVRGEWLAELRRRFALSGEELVRQHIGDERLAGVLQGLGYRGASALNHLMFWHFWANDYWYPRDGMQALCDRLVARLREQGGEVRFRCRVEGLRIAGGRAAGVHTAGGETLGAPTVVYCGDYRRLALHFLPREVAGPVLRRRVRRSRPSESMVSVYLGLDLPAEALEPQLQAHHTYYCPGAELQNPWEGADDPELHRHGFLSVCWTSRPNPALAPAGGSSLVLQAMSNFAWQDTWGTGDDPAARPERYRRLKEEVADQMVQTLEDLIPGVRNHVVYREVGSPLSAQRFTLNHQGATCGWRWDPRKAPFTTAHFETPLPGLLAAGHYTFWPGGVPLSALSGKLVADGILSGYYSDTGRRLRQWGRKAQTRLRKLTRRR